MDGATPHLKPWCCSSQTRHTPSSPVPQCYVPVQITGDLQWGLLGPSYKFRESVPSSLLMLLQLWKSWCWSSVPSYLGHSESLIAAGNWRCGIGLYKLVSLRYRVQSYVRWWGGYCRRIWGVCIITSPPYVCASLPDTPTITSSPSNIWLNPISQWYRFGHPYPTTPIVGSYQRFRMT